MKEQIVTGKKFRILADVTSRLWHVISFWTKAQDVEFNDGTNAQSKLGNIVGISDSLTSTSSNVAASANAVKIINDKVVNQIGNLNNQIENLNEQISQKDQQISDLRQQLENSIKLENVIEYVSMGYRGSGPVTLSKKSCVSVRASRNVTNHDNSTKGYIAVGLEKNGELIACDKDYVDKFGGGSCSISCDVIGEAGDTFVVKFKNLKSDYNWWDPDSGHDGLESCSTNNVADIVVIESK